MLCPKCNLEILDGSQICPNCGVDISKVIEENSKMQQNDCNKEGCGCLVLVFALILLFNLLFGAVSNFGSEDVLKYAPFVIGLLILIVLIACLSKYVKDIVICVGRITLDISTVIGVILSFICLVVGCYFSSFIWWYVLGSVVIFIITLLANYTLYLLIDIRDSLKKLADNVDNKGE
jgi:cation transport ATPase